MSVTIAKFIFFHLGVHFSIQIGALKMPPKMQTIQLQSNDVSSFKSQADAMYGHTSKWKRDSQIFNHGDGKFEEIYKCWKTCAVKAMGLDDFEKRVHSRQTNQPEKTSLSLREVLESQVEPNPSSKKMFFSQMLEQLEQGNNGVHVEQDVFLLRDPNVMFEEHPDADIIAMFDTTGKLYSWYGNGPKQRFQNDDPFYPLGFMLNIGLIGMRANERTTGFMQEFRKPNIADLVSKQYAGEQVIFNEQLLFRPNCTWLTPNGSPLAMNPRESELTTLTYENYPTPPSWFELEKGDITGSCPGPTGPLKVVVLARFKAHRAWQQNGNLHGLEAVNETVAIHSNGGNLTTKQKIGEMLCRD